MSLAKPICGGAAAIASRPVRLISRRSVLAAPLSWALAGTIAAGIALDAPSKIEVPSRRPLPSPIPDIDEYTW